MVIQNQKMLKTRRSCDAYMKQIVLFALHSYRWQEKIIHTCDMKVCWCSAALRARIRAVTAPIIQVGFENQLRNPSKTPLQNHKYA